MKRNCLLLLFLAGSFSLFAQFPLEDGMTWTEDLWSFGQGSRFGGGHQIFEFYLSGDSTVNGHVYKKLYANKLSSWSSFRSWSDEQYIYSYTDTLIEYGVLGLLRLNSEGKTVFLRTSTLPSSHHYHRIINAFEPAEEIPLHEFDLNIGDTVQYKEKSIVVQEIDSIEVSDGKIVKRFWFNNYFGDPTYDYWIEGIGSVYGLFGAYSTNTSLLNTPSGGFFRINLRCFESSGLKMPRLTGNDLYDSCFKNVSAYFDSINAPRILFNEERRKEREEMEEQAERDFQTRLDTLDITFYPNFMSRREYHSLKFELGDIRRSSDVERAIGAIHLFDSNGRHHKSLRGLKWYNINLTALLQIPRLGPGYYLVVFELTNGRRIVKKLVLL